MFTEEIHQGKGIYVRKATEHISPCVDSPVYQSMENMQVCNTMIVAMIKLFCLRFCTPEQHTIVNRGQAIMLFISLINISNAESMESQANKAACTFIFTLILVALAGSM